MRTRLVLTSVVALVAIGVSAGPATARDHEGGNHHDYRACRNGYVSLSYDDGPTTSTPALLTALRRANLRATFFDVGERAALYPDYVRAEVSSGHDVGNHSYDHPDLTTLSAEDALSQLTRTQDILTPLIGHAPVLMRPPYGAINDDLRAVLAEVPLTPIIWTIDTVDWSYPSTKSIVSEALKVEPGGFILMHDGYPNTISAVPYIASGLAAKGLCAGRIVASETPTHAWYGLDFPATVVPW